MRDIQREIQENLDAIETKYDVKILLAVDVRLTLADFYAKLKLCT